MHKHYKSYAMHMRDFIFMGNSFITNESVGRLFGEVMGMRIVSVCLCFFFGKIYFFWKTLCQPVCVCVFFQYGLH